MNNTTNAQERLSPAGLLAVGDAAELTFTRSSQGHIEIEIRTKLGLVKVRVTESNYASLMFGQAHVPGEVVRYLPTRGVVGSANDQAHSQKGRERGPDNTQD
jgi:hypothetical protein